MTGQRWMTVDEVAEFYGVTPASARRLLSDNQIRHVRVYSADEVKNIPRRGRGHRTDLDD